MATVPAVIKGLNGFTEQPIQHERDSEGNWITIRTWEGPRELAANQVSEIDTTYSPDEITLSKGVPCVITARISSKADAADISALPETDAGTEVEAESNLSDSAIWELIGVPLEKDLRSHPKFNISGVSDELLERADQALRRGTASDPNQAWTLNIDKYVSLRLRGVESYMTLYWVLRKTMSTSRRSEVQLAQAGVYSVVSYAGTGIPLNDSKRVKWKQPAVDTWDTSGNYTNVLINQWLYQPPQVRKVGKVYELTREWWGAESWSATLYNGGTGTP